jgi:drug/metabolite transporter (DMT)-like permease
MLWLLTITLSYLFFAVSSLGDKIVLSGPAKPKSYTFFVGIFSILVIFLIPLPFVNFVIPSGIVWGWIILEAFIYVIGLYALFYSLENFEVSKIIPTIGATQPIFIAILSFIFWGSLSLSGKEVLAFIVLLLGSIIISIDKNPKITRRSLEIGLLTSLFFSLDFIFTKFVFNYLSFWPGFIWMRIFSFIFVLFFLLDRGFRKEMAEGGRTSKKTGALFIFTQAAGGAANILQSLSISLVPVAYLAIMNSMKGLQYVFLFIMVAFVSCLMPNVLKEEMSKKIVLQKIISILVIGIGLVILVV